MRKFFSVLNLTLRSSPEVRVEARGISIGRFFCSHISGSELNTSPGVAATPAEGKLLFGVTVVTKERVSAAKADPPPVFLQSYQEALPGSVRGQIKTLPPDMRTSLIGPGM